MPRLPPFDWQHAPAYLATTLAGGALFVLDQLRFSVRRRCSMVINGRKLPEAVMRYVRRGRYQPMLGGPTCLRGRFQFYSRESMKRETDAVVGLILEGDEFFSGRSGGEGVLSILPEPESLVCIGDTGLDSPVCLEYRGGSVVPRVIWLDDFGHWQEVAPNVEGFLCLFDGERARV